MTSGMVFTVIWVLSLLQLLDLAQDWDGQNSSASDIYMCMILAYNLVMTVSILPINAVLILKESSMELFQFTNYTSSSQEDDWSLGFQEILSVFQLLNPMWWVKTVSTAGVAVKAIL